jgi:phage gp29-like protein
VKPLIASSPVPDWRKNAPAGVPLATLARAAQGGASVPASQSPDRATVPLYTIVRPDARDGWMGNVARNYDPARIEQVLRSALTGSLVAQWELFDLMEDTSPRIKKNLNRLKRAVKSYQRDIEPWCEDDEPASEEAIHRAKVVSSALWKMRPRADENQNGFDDTIYDVLDAWAKGIAVLEINWEVRDAGKLGLITAPQSTHYIHPRFYGYPANADWLGLNVNEINSAGSAAVSQASRSTATEAAPTVALQLAPVDGLYARFPENKFLICVCKTKSGHPAGGALLRALAFWWAAANFTQEWFLNLAQIFGLPIRWANYDPNVPGLVEKILDMLENMGSAGYAAFPAGTTLELKEPMKAGTDNPQVSLLDRFERACDFLILGQSGTTEVAGPGKTGGSNAANQVLQDVEGEIIAGACEFVENVFDQQLIPAINRLNFLDDLLCPELCLAPNIIEDVAGLVTNYKTAVEAQAITPNVDDEKHLRQKLSLPAMNKDVEADWASNKGVRQKITAQPGAGFGAPSPGGEGRGEGGIATARARAQNTATDKLVENTLEKLTGVEARWLGGLKPVFHRLIALAQSKEVSDDDFVQALAKAQAEMPELFSRLDAAALEDALNDAMSAAVVNGAVRGELERGRARRSARAGSEVTS